MKTVTYSPIGVIHSPFLQTVGMPIQSQGAETVAGRVEINKDLAPGLKDLEGFSHIILFYHFHLSEGYSLEVKPFLDDQYHGVFATRAPKRPNAIGISIVKLIRIEGHILHIEGVDVVDETPLLDIKPYVPEFDVRCTDKVGWLTGKAQRMKEVRADKRFE